VAAQIYGPDLGILQKLGETVGRAIKTIDCVTDVRVEQGAGLRYLRIKPDRMKLARYGLTVEDVNTLTEATAVGHAAGIIFENDRRFDLIVKFSHIEPSIEAFRDLPLKTATGQMIPLGDVADVVIENGPAVVNRDHQSRRRIVEFNVRGRDMLSVVNDAKKVVTQNIELPTGYHIVWGGQFQHFINARERLFIVVPLALALILFLLWLAFHSIKPALLIFLNIPFAIVGGVFALAIRGLPFSISAGIGFIALFGVAVLNGLVLLSFCRQLEQEGMPPHKAIVSAAQRRLRPVLMTAMVAALGFLPMALSTSPGSEVQRPLATVVIGGLLSATALTLLLLPVVYILLHRKKHP
jgi:cobalt-zinc-cadmium resistance protein CzcA